MRNQSVIKFVLCFAAIVLAAGCSSTKVTRVDVDEKIDLSGKWNDYDAMLVAREMVIDSLERPWREEFLKLTGRNPVVIVGHVANRSSEHIDTQVFVKYLERSLINSGKVIFVANSNERSDVREERVDQQKGLTDPATMAAIGKERGADFMLIGQLSSINDSVKGTAVVFYQTNLELINLVTNEKVWIGQKQLKKVVKKSRYGL